MSSPIGFQSGQLIRGRYAEWLLIPCFCQRGVGEQDPSLSHPTFQAPTDCSSQLEGWDICGTLALLHRASPGAFESRWYTSGEPWPAPVFLHGAPLHNPGSLEVLWGKVVLLPQHTQAGWAVHQPSFSSYVAGSLKVVACQQASPFTSISPKHSSLEHMRDQNSLLHLDTLSLFCM